MTQRQAIKLRYNTVWLGLEPILKNLAFLKARNAGFGRYANGTLYASCNVNEIEAFDANGNGSFFASTQNGPWFMAFQPVPEPSALGLLAIGMFGITLLRRCQR
jgi:hypothetical protein